MNTNRNFSKKLFSILIVLTLILSMMPIQPFAKTAFDPKEDHKQLDLRFWEDEQPDIGFYINASSRYILETVTEPKMGSTFGEWSVMDLLRGMYTGYDYINYIPENYFEKYLQGIEGYVIGKKGELDRNKSTEWSRLILALSSLGYDITNVGTPGDYLLTYTTWNTGIVNAVPISGNSIVLKNPEKIYLNALNDKTNKYTNQYVEFPAGKYNLDQEANTITDESGNVFKLSTVNQFVTIEKGYDFIDKLSKSYKFSYRQGINGPIWVTIAMNTGGYDLYEDETNADVNTVGKMIGYVLSKEITQKDGTIGGWALSGASPDPDITGMALQALAPYYLDRTKFEAELVSFVDTKGNKVKDYTYEEFAQAVERAIYVLSLIQRENGGYASFGSVGSESIVQVITALTALDIDPLQENIELKHIGKTIDFITEGKEYEGVFTNNMIDALLTYWANGSGSSPEVGGFKHVTAGYDGGGGSGTGVNAMATDQALYGLIAYDRFLKGENDLYDMTDMTSGQYKGMKATKFTAQYVSVDEEVIDTKEYSPYSVMEIREGHKVNGKEFVGWNTKADGTGAMYKPGERLSTPNHEIKLYAQYKNTDYAISYELNGGHLINESVQGKYTIADSDIVLPVAEEMAYENHTFSGWYDNAELTGEAILVIPSGSLGDRQYFAKWISDEDIAKEVIEQIAKLPQLEKLTLEDQETVKVVRQLYDQLTDSQRVFVTDYDVLVAAEAKLSELLEIQEEQATANSVITLIEKLPAADSISLVDQESVQAARSAFNRLTVTQQKWVSNYETLLTLESKLVELGLEVDQQMKDQAAAKVVSAIIDKLPEEANVTLDYLTQVEEVKAQFAKLTTEQQAYVENHGKLIALESKLIQLLKEAEDKKAAIKVIEQINSLPKESAISIESESEILSAKAAYQNLTSAQQQYVTNYDLLVAIQSKLDALIKQAAEQAIASEKLLIAGKISKNISLTASGTSDVVYGPEEGTIEVTGDVVINGDANGKITLRNTTIKGNLFVNTPNASVVIEDSTKVDGDTTIQNVAIHTLTNNGQLGEVIILDKDGTRFINNEGANVGTVVINTPGDVVIGGNITSVIIEQANTVKIMESSTITNLTVNAEVTLEIAKKAVIENLKAEAKATINGEGIVNNITGSQSTSIIQDKNSADKEPETNNNQEKVEEPEINNNQEKVEEAVTNSNSEKSTNDGQAQSMNEDKSSSERKETKTTGSGSKLPETATNYFNMLLIGVVLVLVGSVAYFSRRKKLD
ncbi:InlB B-repeat-containing protein [Bacillus sp. AGMB 02131]|uniref:InlB B-repeat-containing protein n=1 Tax=Peribacillus faecalis TaxID=2772559 RepID=A0A927CTY6_9BACI|nr:InlB B-repeat-containing protein [Peribacillus faecalis]MBD3107401.1 InlB B-repeat-containing protein [Peribacillus faecalis]